MEPSPSETVNLDHLHWQLGGITQPLTDPGEIVIAAARLLAVQLDVDRCAFAEVEDQSTYVITGDYSRGLPSIVGRWQIAAFGRRHHQMMLANEPYIVEDSETDPGISDEDRSAYRATGIRSVICVPLHKDGQLTAAMAVHQKTPRRWTPAETRLVTSIVGRCWEALERARVTRALRENERRYRTLFNAMDEGYCIIEVLFDDQQQPADYRFVEVNSSFERQSGMHDVVGRRMLEFVPAIERHWLQNYGDVARTGTPVRFDGEYKGLNRWFDVYAFRADGWPENHVAVLFSDITRRRKAEMELKDADARKDEFLAMLAHELRNPLAPIRNSLSILRLAGDDSATREQLYEMMDRQLNHLVRLVDDLTEVSRITRGKIELRKARIDLARVIESAVETSRPLIDAAKHQLTVSLSREPLILEADAVRLTQVITNLLNNAAKYTRESGQISLTSYRDGDAAVISIRDNGVGIQSDMLSRVFDLFIQADRTYDRSQGGLGIGLTLARRLVEMHSGTVGARSDGPGAGSEFIVRLPLASANRGHGSNSIPSALSGPLGPLRMLVVDDNRDAANSLSLLLKVLGAEVHTVNDGTAALDACRTVSPAVALLDIGMPGMDGYELARRIRQSFDVRQIRLIALTGWGQDEDRRRSAEAGFDHHLVKPVDLQALQSVLSAIAERT